MSKRVGDWIGTYCGGLYYPLDPRVEEVRIEDIAHSLSMLCRYNGHCKFFYSVAEHCWLLSTVVPEQYRLEALMHDASEAYLSDMPRPVKHLKTLTAYRDAEELNRKVIYKYAGLPEKESLIIKEYDSRILRNEAEVLMPRHDWYKNIEPIPNAKIFGLSPNQAEEIFLRAYEQLNPRTSVAVHK